VRHAGRSQNRGCWRRNRTVLRNRGAPIFALPVTAGACPLGKIKSAPYIRQDREHNTVRPEAALKAGLR